MNICIVIHKMSRRWVASFAIILCLLCSCGSLPCEPGYINFYPWDYHEHDVVFHVKTIHQDRDILGIDSLQLEFIGFEATRPINGILCDEHAATLRFDNLSYNLYQEDTTLFHTSVRHYYDYQEVHNVDTFNLNVLDSYPGWDFFLRLLPSQKQVLSSTGDTLLFIMQDIDFPMDTIYINYPIVLDLTFDLWGLFDVENIGPKQKQCIMNDHKIHLTQRQ